MKGLIIVLVTLLLAGIATCCYNVKKTIDNKDTVVMPDSTIQVKQGEIRPDDESKTEQDYIALINRHIDLIAKSNMIKDSIIKGFTEFPQDVKHEKIINKMIDRYNSLVKPDRDMRDSIDFYERLLGLKKDTSKITVAPNGRVTSKSI